MEAKRESWGSRIGFIMAVAGSAIGLANIWRFPYIVGKNGGAAFIILYLIFLMIIGFPVFISEMLIGRATHTSPSGAFKKLGKTKIWSWMGKLTILTGFIVSSFYSAVAGWILGYLVEAVRGNLSSFESCDAVSSHYQCLMNSAIWGVGFHFLFMFFCVFVLYMGVRNGIERANKWMMPMLYMMLILLAIRGVTLPNASEGLHFLFTPNWSLITPVAIVTALGQAFFTLSLGQGTMVTYGSYLSDKENILGNCFPVAIMDTVVSLLAAIAVLTIVFSTGMEPTAGPGLLFNTLPWVFSQLPGGYLLAIAFFLLVVMAAITSEVSAMEPTIAYLMDEWGWKRHPATFACGAGAFLLGIPSALSLSLLKDMTFYDMTFLDIVGSLCSDILIPLGGLLAVILVGWVWKMSNAFDELKKGAEHIFEKHTWLKHYLWVSVKYTAPILIIIVFLNALGVLA